MLFLKGWKMLQATTANEVMLGLSEQGYWQLQTWALRQQAAVLFTDGEPELAAQLLAGCKAVQEGRPAIHT